MKKSLGLILSSCSFVFSAGFINPLPFSSRALENGGPLSAIDAYQDGVGAMVINNGRGIDNSAMNNLVFKYGNEAKDNGLSICDQVVLSGSIQDKILNGFLCADGSPCNDNNQISIGETYLNGICQGGLIPDGTICSDELSNTINDKYMNQICVGKIVLNPLCSDGDMVWNANINLCEKNNISNYTATINNNYTCPSGGALSGTTCLKSSSYTATHPIAGYTISNDSLVGGCGLQKNGNTFRTMYTYGTITYGANVYLDQNGILVGNSIANSSVALNDNGTSIGVYINGVSSPVSKSGTSISANTWINNGYGFFFGLTKLSSTTFSWHHGSWGDATATSWVPFYGSYTCPSGGTLSGTTCTINQNYIATNTPYYTCPSGGTLSGTICTINTYQSATGICQIGYTLTNNQCVQN